MVRPTTAADLIVFRNVLVTRLCAARVIARGKGLPHLADRCTQKIAWIKGRADMDLRHEVDGVDDLIGDIHRAGTIEEQRAAYAASFRAVEHLMRGAA